MHSETPTLTILKRKTRIDTILKAFQTYIIQNWNSVVDIFITNPRLNSK